MCAAYFQQGDGVLLRRTMEMGMILDPPKLQAGEYWYRVRFSKRVENVVEDDLDIVGEPDESLATLAAEGRWGRLQAVRCALGVERIQNVNRSTIYAFRSQRILFEPYQYKPLLKVLDSPDRRVLIADEVGLGKTIEAGLVLTELAARRSLDRVLVVCPSRLREKWRNELNGKFDQDFEILDKQSFLNAATRAHENPGRFRLQGIISSHSLRNDDAREALMAELGHLDMVVIDEAHHARNRNTATSALLRDLCEVGHCVLLLTATPLHLKSEDLFTLVNALRPAEFRDAYVFDAQLEHHAPVHVASALARTQQLEQLPAIAKMLTDVFCAGADRAQHDPKAAQVIRDIAQSPPSNRREWVELERQIQELHPLGSIVTRTRKRDVLENAPERRAGVFYCDWSADEDEAYQRLVEGSGPLGWLQSSLSFGQIQRARQAASCLPAAYAANHEAASDDEAVELCDILPSEAPPRAGANSAKRSIGAWSGEDSKFAKLREILDEIWQEEPGAKVLIFTFFRGTARYLEQRINSPTCRALRIDGDVVSDPRHPERDDRGKRIHEFQANPEVKVLVSTEVGSEGLDFQFCHHLVNYDLPWNPMVVEQRIGRIDRFGQESKVVHIHNLVVRGSVEDKILERLYTRIGIFERSIGNLEAILGEVVSELQQAFVKAELTPEESERRVEQAANAVKHKSTDLEILEKQASELFGHEEFIRDEMNRVRNLGRYISEESILALLSTYFESNHPQVRIKPDGEQVYGCRLTDALRQDILDASRGGILWDDRSREGIFRFTMNGEIAFRRRELDLVNAAHPLVQAAVKKVAAQLESQRSRIGQAVLSLADRDEQGLAPGRYYFLLFAHSISSIRTRRLLETVAWRAEDDMLLDAETGERLLYLCIEHGREWPSDEPIPPLPEAVWDRLVSAARTQNRAIHTAETRENEALYLRRSKALQAEHEHDVRVKQQRLDTAIRRGSKRILPAMQGQIEKAKSEFRQKMASLDAMQEAHVTLSEPLAACAVVVTP